MALQLRNLIVMNVQQLLMTTKTGHILRLLSENSGNGVYQKKKRRKKKKQKKTKKNNFALSEIVLTLLLKYEKYVI